MPDEAEASNAGTPLMPIRPFHGWSYHLLLHGSTRLACRRQCRGRYVVVVVAPFFECAFLFVTRSVS